MIKAGGWLDPETGERYDDQGRALGSCWPSDWPEGWVMKTILTCAHLDQNPTHNDPSNLTARCPRCTCATTGASASRAPTATSASGRRWRIDSTDQDRYPNRSNTPSRISKSANSTISRPRPSAPQSMVTRVPSRSARSVSSRTQSGSGAESVDLVVASVRE